MSTKIRILTYHHIANNGAFLFAHSLVNLFQEKFRDSDVKIVDYKTIRLGLYEYLKRFKLFKRIPFFYWQRSKLWDRCLPNNLPLDHDYPKFASHSGVLRYLSNRADALVTGMDVWCLNNPSMRPSFPNIYWLTNEMDIPKIAYAVSGYNSNSALIQAQRDEIKKYINAFDVIGSRDRFTHQMVTDLRTRPDGLVDKIPDPTFLYEIKPTGIEDKLSSLGVDLTRPILGTLLYGNTRLTREIQVHYSAKGYQILALSMYNPYADINLGHLLDPFEWAEIFKHLTFCISDRFHGTLFCLKNQTPFISLEKEHNIPRGQSKLYDLLIDFDMQTCYHNPYEIGFEYQKFLDHADDIERSWDTSFRHDISPKIHSLNKKHHDFIGKMKAQLTL